MPFDVLVAGEIFYDMIFTGLERMPVLGEETFASGVHTAPGGVAITAIALKRLEIEPALASDLGNDPTSDYLRKAVLAEGVADTLITRHDRPLPTITVALSFPHDRAFVSYMDDRASAFGPERFGPGILDQAGEVRHLLIVGMQTALSSERLIAEARRRGIDVSLDGQCSPETLESDGTGHLLRSIDNLIPNADEALHLTGARSIDEALEILTDYTPTVVIKAGAEGAVASFKGTKHCVEAIDVDPVDTTGAGDCFNAGFIYGRLAGLGPVDTLRCGVICGGLSTTRSGGASSAPTAGELGDRLNRLRGEHHL